MPFKRVSIVTIRILPSPPLLFPFREVSPVTRWKRIEACNVIPTPSLPLFGSKLRTSFRAAFYLALTARRAEFVALDVADYLVAIDLTLGGGKVEAFFAGFDAEDDIAAVGALVEVAGYMTHFGSWGAWLRELEVLVMVWRGCWTKSLYLRRDNGILERQRVCSQTMVEGQRQKIKNT